MNKYLYSKFSFIFPNNNDPIKQRNNFNSIDFSWRKTAYHLTKQI